MNIADNLEHVHGPEEITCAEDELVVVCLLRDGRPYIESFVEHYFSLGTKHLIFMDNGSTDGTVEALQGYENVTVLRCLLPFKEYQFEMKRYLTGRFGKDRWSLCVDIDELFDYPYSDVVDLGSFLRYLSERSYTAVIAHMLEMLPDEPLQDSTITLAEDVPLKELYRFYDLSNVRADNWRFDVARGTGNTFANPEISSLWGGVKMTIFGRKTMLTKHPLVYSDGKVKPVDGTAHRVSNAHIADITCVLYHYKFLDDFYEKIRQAVQQENYMKDSVKQKGYLKILEQTTNLQLKQETARELKGVNELVSIGFLAVSRDYINLVGEEEKKSDVRGTEDTLQRLTEAFLSAHAVTRTQAQKIGQLQADLDYAERGIEKGSQKAGQLQAQLDDARKGLRGQQHLADRNRDLEVQMRAIQASRSWKLLSVLSRVKRAFSKRRG